MIILPDKNRKTGKILLPMQRSEWMEKSERAGFDRLEHGVRTRWRLRAHHPDTRKHIWEGWFSDREDIDALLFSIINGDNEPELWDNVEEWRRPNENWHFEKFYSDFFGEIQPLFAVSTVTFFTSTGSGTWTVVSDYNTTSNKIEVIAGGGSGGCGVGSNLFVTGGGGGGYSAYVNLALGIGTSVNYSVGTAGGAVSTTTSLVGNSGADSWFNGTTLAGSWVGAVHGNGGNKGTGVQSAASGGATTSATGQTKWAGGNSGATSGSSGSSGAGGAAGPNGAGTNGATASSASSAGGSGDNGHGGSGSSGVNASSTASSSAGGNGTEWDASHGSGGGSGGVSLFGSGTSTTGAGGNYGAGSGGSFTGGGTAKSSIAGQGIVVVTYTPTVKYAGLYLNSPMLGI